MLTQDDLNMIKERAKKAEDIPKLVAEVERLKSAIAEAISDIETISPHEAKKTLLEALENGD